MNELKTPYEWCLESNIRLLEIPENNENVYMLVKFTKEEFLDYISEVKVKPNSTPRKPEKFLELRMYGLVPYNISPIQAGIQYGHAVVEYQQSTRQIPGIEDVYNRWASRDKTFIILNGGTTNETPDDKFYGTMQKNRDLLADNDILFAEFREPDLNNTLTAVVFLVDERVWNRDLYEDFVPETLPWSRQKPSEKKILELEEKNNLNYKHWIDKIGGPKNAFLRDFLKPFRLANN